MKGKLTKTTKTTATKAERDFRQGEKTHKLTGLWQQIRQCPKSINWTGSELYGEVVKLGAVNGKRGVLKNSGASVFVVTTGPRKGIWYNISVH